MRKIFLPLTIILLLLFCAPAFAQKIKPPADCNVSAGEITVTHSSPTIKCPGVNSTTLVLNGNDEGDIVWFSSVDGEIWELVEGVTGTQYVASNLLDTTYFIVEVRNGPGTCWGYSNIVRISISMPVWYKDGDGDHYADTVHQCTKPGIGYTITPIAPPGDCNDSDGSIHPGAPEIIDGIDNDCDGSIDEGYSNTGFEDVIIPNGISSIAITVQGAKGGSIKKQDTHGGDLVGSPAIVASGGRGARLNAKFRVETDCQQGLKPGGKLRFIIGGTPDAIIRNQEVPSPPGAAPTSSGQGGGGGTAILYQAPGTSSWVLLAVAGGGGGAFSRNDGLNSFNSNGIAAIQPGFNLTTTGPDGMGGKGIFIQQIIPDDDPRDGGQIIIINISGGGGGAFGDATQSCGGKKGMDEGGTSTICTSGSAGGYGFGAGGSGISRLDNPSTPADNEEGGGGGGGGYSGGNGGGNATGGFGGGSYISDLAFESSWLTSSSADNGSIIIETNPIDNSDCCDPESLAFTGSYADVNLGCNPADPDASLGTATATDASGAVTITSTDGPVISDGCNRSRTRTFTATDGCNNTVTTSRTVRWVADLTPPSFTGSYAEVNLGCNPANPDGSLGTATATDANGAVTITSTDSPVVSDGCNRSRTRTFTATDGCGNTTSTFRTVRWIADLTPPTLTSSSTVANNSNLGCNPTAGAIDGALGTATATDACSNPTVTPSDGLVSSDGCSRSQTRRWTAIDACGNTSTASRTINWIADLTPPTLTSGGTVANNSNLGCNPTPGAIDGALGTATATDACSNPTVTPGDGPVTSDGCTRIQTRTFRAIDACGNTSTASRTISWIADLTPPTLTSGGTVANNSNLGCNPTPGAIDGALGTATATDACSNPTVTPSDGPVSSDGCSRSQTRTFRVIDACGNTSTASRTISWIADLTPPTLTSGGTVANNSNLGCNPSAGTIDGALGTATATDACSNPTVTPSDGPVSSDGCSRSQTRTFRAIDACGNTSTASRTISWIADLTPPTLTSGGTVANNSNLGCNPTAGDINGALGTATATDACSNPTVTPTDGPVSSDGCSRSQTRTFRVIDACGNTSTVARTVTWTYDKTAPTLTSGGTTFTLEWNPSTSAIDAALGTATATDACGTPTVTPGDGSVTGDCLRSQTRTFTAKDGCGNTSTVSRIVTWKFDLTAPTLNCPSNQTVNLGSTCTALLPNYISLATASDNCTATGSITITQYPAVGTSLSGTGTQPVTLKATDAAGNTSTCSFTVNKVDNTPPVITNALPGIYVLSPANHKMRDVTINYSLADNCGGTTSSVLSVSSNEPINGTGDGDIAPDWEVVDNHNVKLRAERSGLGDGRVYTITIKATDASGNTSTSSVEVRVTHNITSPQSGKSFKVGSTVSLEGEFWDKPGNKHTATWLIDDNTTVNGTVIEPAASRNGKVTGSYKFTTAGVYKLQMNTKDQNNVISYANTSGDMEAIIVIYDPNGGYTYGGGYFNSPAGAITSNVSASGKASYGFSVNYFKGATYPKGETQFEFKIGEFEFNALNFEYLSIAGAKAQMKGTGKIIGGQSGINFILTVTDGQLDGSGIDKIRMKIYNKNTMQVYYDNQPGANDAVNPTMPVQENSTIVISGSNVTDLTLPNQTITKEEQDIAPVADGLQVKVMPNPSSTNFRITVNSSDLKEPVKLLVTDMLGRVIETRMTNTGQTITIGDKYISGTYAVRIMQGRKMKQLELIKLSD